MRKQREQTTGVQREVQAKTRRADAREDDVIRLERFEMDAGREERG